MIERIDDRTIESIKTRLGASTSKEKIAWTRSILNTKEDMVGGSVPLIRSIAREIVSANIEDEFLKRRDTSCYELILMRGFVIAYSKVDEDVTLHRLSTYLDDVACWEEVDGIASAVKFKSESYRRYLIDLLDGDNEWRIRYGIAGLMMSYFDTHLEDSITRILGVDKHTYYIDMAIAWAISVAYVKGKDTTMRLLDSANIEDNILKMSLRKVIDSHRVTEEDKSEYREYIKKKLDKTK